jgi:hypothetical protein
LLLNAGADDTDDFSDGIMPADGAMNNKQGPFINTVATRDSYE